MQPLTSLSSIIGRYDAILLDQWGVVHDGTNLYPGVREALSALKSAGKKVVMVSNAPRRAHKTEAVLKQLGITPELYGHVITSGEMGFQWLASGAAPWGKRYFFIGPARDADVLNGLDYVRVESVAAADFLLNVGFGSESDSAEDWQQPLRAARAKNLPMLCLNPDMEVVKITGERYACAGVLAADYERMGGEVKYFGKPFPDVYAYCMQYLAPLPKSRVLAIGDGIATDIAGAVQAGIDSVLILGGIFQKDAGHIEALCRKMNAMPNYVMPQLKW